jgi:flagellar hook-associated protein 1 FlgK
MGTGALSSLGTRALGAAFAQLQTTGNNIANANTRGYSRQEVELSSSNGQYTGAGFFGRGVDITTVTRAHDDFLTQQAALARSQASADSARSDQLAQLEKVFGVGEAGLGYSATQFFNAFTDVSTKPQDETARQVVLARANDLASRFNAAAQQIDTLQAGVTQQVQVSVAAVNSLTEQIAALNKRIVDARGLGQPPNDLLDKRDTAINDLSQYVQVSTVPADDGSLSVFLGGGQSLVVGAQTTKLLAMYDPYDATRAVLGVAGQNGSRQLDDSLLSSGSIAGLLRFQNSDLTDARNQLGQLALGIGQQVNDQQALGLDLLGQPGAAMFRFGDVSGAPVITGRSLATNSGSGSVSLTLQSPSALAAAQISGVQASDYELTADGAGGYQLQRLSGGVPDLAFAARTVANGDIVDGFQINVSGTAAAGDRFLLQPAGSAARDFRLDMVNPKLIAAASPLSVTAGSSNRGTGSVLALTAGSVSAGSHPDLPATLRFQVTATPGQYTYTWTDASGTSTPAAWQPGQPIDYPGTTASNGFKMTITGVPVAADPLASPAVIGDSFTVGRNTYPLSDNRNANGLLSLRDASLVGAVWNGGTLQPGASVTDAYANVIANVGVRVQSAKASADLSSSVAEQANKDLAAKSGVNLDEEAARLIQYQQSYQAAAKMLQVAQSIFDSLLQLAR